MNRHFTKEDIWMAHEKMLNFGSHQGMQIKTTLNYDYILIRMAKEKIMKIPDAVEHTNWISHTLLIGMLNGTATLEKSLGISNKVKHPCIRQPSSCTPGFLSRRNEKL